MHPASTTAIIEAITHPPVDAVIIVAILFIILIDAIRSGTARAATLSVVFPLTFFFTDILSHAAIIGPMLERFSAPLAQATLFGIMFGILFFLVYRIMYAVGGVGSTPFVSIVASIAATIVSLVIWLQVPALQSVWHFSPIIVGLFGGIYAFWWLIASFLLMAFVRS